MLRIVLWFTRADSPIFRISDQIGRKQACEPPVNASSNMTPPLLLSPRPEQNWVEAYRVSDYGRAAARRWKLSLLTAALGLAVAYTFCWFFPDTFVSYAQLLFLPPQVSEKFVESNISLHADQRVTALTQMIGSHSTAGKIIQEFGLYPRLRRFWPVADLVPTFRQDLTIRVIGNTQTEGRRAVPTVEISFRYSDPAQAQKVVQRILETIYEENQRIRSNQTFRTTDFLQRQTREIYDQLKLAEEKLEQLNLADPAQRLQATAMATEKLHEIHRRLYASQFDLRRAISDRDLKGFQLASLSSRAESAGSEAIAGGDTSWAGHTWRIKIADARSRLDEARQRYRQGFPERDAAERDLVRAQEELKRVEDNDRNHNEYLLRQRFTDEAERLRAEIEGLNGNIATLKKETAGLLEQEKAAVASSVPNHQDMFQHLAAIREHDLLKKRHEEMLKKQRDSEVATEMERVGQGETIDMIEPPILPTMAKIPVRWMKLFGGFVCGLAFGWAIPIVSLLQRPRVQSAHRLEALLGTPILGELPAVRMSSLPGGGTVRGRRIRLVISTHSSLALTLTLSLAAAGCQGESAAGLLDRGMAKRKAGKHAEAALLLRRAIGIDKRCGECYRQLGELASENNEVAAARQALIRAVEFIPDEPALRVKLAELTYRLFFADPGRPDSLLREVETLAEQLQAQWPARADGYRLAAQALLERRRIREAVTVLEDGLRRIPGEPSLATQLASALYQDGDATAAAAALEGVIEAGAAYAPAYDLYYLQLMETGSHLAAERVLRAKWKVIGAIEPGLQLAAHMLATGRQDEALATLDQAAARNPADPRAPLGIADFWINRADQTRARLWLERGRRSHPGSAPLYAGREIELLLAAGQRDSAQQLLTAEIKANPGNPLLQAYRAAIDLDQPGGETVRQSRVHLEAILNRMPNSPFVRYHLGRAYLRDGDVARAGAQFEQCVTLDPNYAMGWLALADAHLQQGKYSSAAEEAKFLAMRGATLAPVYLIGAQAELGRNRPGEAERSLEALLRVAPKHPEGQVLMVQSKLALGKTVEARRYLKDLLGNEPDRPETLAMAARLEASLGQSQAAFDRLRTAQGKYPDNASVATALAQVATGIGNFDVALAQYIKLSAMRPEALEYALGVANSLALLKKNAEAADQYKKVQSISGNDSRPWLNYAIMMAEAGDWQQATSGYREALRRSPKNPVALNNLADLLTRRNGDLSEALNLAEQAGRILPDAPEVIDTLAFAYLRKGMSGNAVASYRKLLERVPKPQRERIQGRIARIERGDLSGALTEAGEAGTLPGAGLRM